MADFKMPALGADVDSAMLVEWRVKPGDTVKRGDVIAEVETGKGLIEVETFQAGVIEEFLVQPGTTVAVGTVLARLKTDEPTPTVPAPTGRRRVTPAARAAAEKLGVDLGNVDGTGPGGAVTREDVEKAAGNEAKPAAAPPSDAVAAIRRATAAAMSRSKREIPHYYLSARVDMGRALEWLSARNAERPVAERLLASVLFVKAVARAAAEVPDLNGFWVDGEFRKGAGVHVGFAIALRKGGLVAPAVHDADRKTVDELMRDLGDLISRARSGSLRGSELADPTITVTSLGELGVEAVFGVIHPPQVAIVGFGRISEQPWILDGRVVPRPIVTVSLSADHRASDGHGGARFLTAVDRFLQTPETL